MAFRRSASTPLLRSQQLAADHEQIRQCRGDFQTVQILRQSAIAHLLKAEHPLDHPEDVLDLRAYLRLGTILRPLDLIDLAVVAIGSVGEVLRSRSAFAAANALSAPL